MTSKRHAFIRFSLNKFWCHVWRDVSFRLSWWLDLERQEESALEATQEAPTTCPGVYAISCYSEIMQWSLNQTTNAWPREDQFVQNCIYIINTIINHFKHTFEVHLCLKGLLLEICSARKSNQSRCLRQFRSRPGSIWKKMQKSLEILGTEETYRVKQDGNIET